MQHLVSHDVHELSWLGVCPHPRHPTLAEGIVATVGNKVCVSWCCTLDTSLQLNPLSPAACLAVQHCPDPRSDMAMAPRITRCAQPPARLPARAAAVRCAPGRALWGMGVEHRPH